MLAAFAMLSRPARISLLCAFFSTVVIYPAMVLAYHHAALDEVVTYFGFFALPVIWCAAAALSPAPLTAIAFFGGVAIYAAAGTTSVLLSPMRIDTESEQIWLAEGISYCVLQGALWAAGWLLGLVIRGVWVARGRAALLKPNPNRAP
ncbi:MAG: hypothetical protein ABI740_01805 [Alphaproteobacteria bacterium]